MTTRYRPVKGDRVKHPCYRSTLEVTAVGETRCLVKIAANGLDQEFGARFDMLTKVVEYPEGYINVYANGTAGSWPSRSEADRWVERHTERIGILHLRKDGTTEMLQP